MFNQVMNFTAAKGGLGLVDGARQMDIECDLCPTNIPSEVSKNYISIRCAN